MSNLDRDSMVALSNYGKGLKNYAIAKLIWTGFMIITTVLFGSSLTNLTTLNEQELMENAGTLLLLMLFVIFGFIGGGIYLIVRYISYFIKLYKASKSFIGTTLKANLIVEFLLFATFLIASNLIIPNLIYCNLVTIVLLIVATIYLGKWASSLPNHEIDENNINQMLSSIRIMKIGLFVKLGVFLRLFAITPMNLVGSIIYYIGDIIFIVGMLKTANVIMGTFDINQTENSMALRNRSSVQIPSPENEQYTMQSNPATIQSSNSKNECPFCNSPIIDPNTAFCSVCGKKIK